MWVNKNALMGSLLAIIFVMAVGYAVFATQLKIGGLVNSTSKWDVHIKSITAGTPNGTASVKTEPSVSADKLSATFSTILQKPKDSLTYTVVVENSGNLDASLADIVFTTGNSEAIEFTYNGISKNDRLNSGKTISFTVTASYKDINNQPETKDLVSNVNMTLTYVQAY